MEARGEVPLKFSELLFILLYLEYFAPPKNVRLPPLPLKIFLPNHGMFSSCDAADCGCLL